VASPNLIALAILQANWDASRDFLANFEPFVVAELQAWPSGEAIDEARLTERLCESSGIALPVNVVKTLLRRARRTGLLAKARHGGADFTVPERLDQLDDLTIARERARNEMDDLLARVIRFASEHHQMEWAPEDADKALASFLDDFGLEFLRRSRRGQRAAELNGAAKGHALVQAFARWAFDHDQRGIALLEHAVQGSMLATVVHYRQPDDAKRRLSDVVVYLDTPILLRLLGVSIPQLTEAAVEMRELLRESNVPCRVFRHTVDEIRSVLASTAGNLRASRSKALADTARLSRTSREVLDYFLSTGKSAGDVEAIAADLERRLLRLGVNQEDTPDHTERLTLGEDAIGEVLQARVGYRNEGAKRRDIDSFTAIFRLRNGRQFHELGECKAVFVTPNTAYAFATREYMRDQEPAGGVPQVLTDLELTTQVWVRTPSARPDLPLKLLIADSFAALNPAPRVWDKYLKTIERLQEQGEITEEQVTALVFSTTARNEMMDLTLGDIDAIEDESVVETLERLEHSLATPRVEEAQRRADAEQAESDRRIAELESALAGEQEARKQERQRQEEEKKAYEQELERQEGEKNAREKSDLERTARMRQGMAIGCAALLAGASVLLVFFTDWSPLGKTGASLALITLASIICGVGFRRASAGWWAFVAVGVAVGLASAIYTFADDDSPNTSPTPTVVPTPTDPTPSGKPPAKKPSRTP
jgi:hypothetical protein